MSQDGGHGNFDLVQSNPDVRRAKDRWLLTPATEVPGPHALTVRNAAARAPLSIAHEFDLALRSHAHTTPVASTASHPDVRDDRDTPLR